jgi:hypothetical protein
VRIADTSAHNGLFATLGAHPRKCLISCVHIAAVLQKKSPLIWGSRAYIDSYA